MFCTGDCSTDITVPPLPDICDVQPRNVCPAKLIVFRCDVTIPTGTQAAIAAALVAMLTAGTLGATGKLKNFVWADPTTSAVSFADCDAPHDEVIGRDLTFEDYNAIDIDDTGAAAPFYDRDFWNTVANNKIWNFGYTDCDGNLYLLTKDSTTFSNGQMSVFTTEDRSQANKCLEVKKGKVSFLGDPKKRFPKPFLNIPSVLGASPELKILYA